MVSIIQLEGFETFYPWDFEIKNQANEIVKIYKDFELYQVFMMYNFLC